jgi:hypothetical protein
MLTFVVQTDNKLTWRVKEYDIFNLLPNYKFFCPVPARRDYQLYFRSYNGLEMIHEWKRIEVFPKRNFMSWLWNPSKKKVKSFSRIVQVIGKKYRNKSTVSYGFMYMQLVNYIKSFQTDELIREIQFKITYKRIHSNEFEEQDYYISNIHKI